jgi:transmembrane sensor
MAKNFFGRKGRSKRTCAWIVALTALTLLRPSESSRPAGSETRSPSDSGLWAASSDTSCGRKTIALADGSEIQVSPDGCVTVQLSAQRRLVRLVSGEALFRVKHDPVWPFMVKAGAATVTDVGTRFDLYLQGNSIRILELEGRVNIYRTPGESLPSVGQTAVSLSAGHRIDVRGDSGETGAVMRLTPEDIASMTAWVDGKIMGNRLGYFLDQFERYHDGVRFEADSRIRGMETVARYSIENLDVFLAALKKHYCIGVVSIPDKSGGRTIVLTRVDSGVSGGECQ